MPLNAISRCGIPIHEPLNDEISIAFMNIKNVFKEVLDMYLTVLFNPKHRDFTKLSQNYIKKFLTNVNAIIDLSIVKNYFDEKF